MIDRRRFLGFAPLAAVAARGTLADAQPAASASRPGEVMEAPRRSFLPGLGRFEPLGVQLYTVRSEMARDPERTLEAIAEIGYGEVELAGLYGMSAREMRVKLDAVGLRAASSHHGLDAVRDDWDRTLEGALELGQALIVVPSIAASERTTDGLRRVADDLNLAGEAAARVGLRLGYHNHDWELRPLEDRTVPLRLLLDRTDSDVVDWQMDVFWTVHGGGDVMEYLAEAAGRVTSVHLKDRTESGEMVDVGEGDIPFDPILAEAARLGLLHAFVEHDRPSDALDSLRRSYRHLTRVRERDAFDERTA